jgi:hypothetical protein
MKAREMKEGPSGSSGADPNPPQAAAVKSRSGEHCGNVGDKAPAGTVARGERKRTTAEVSKAERVMSERGVTLGSRIPEGRAI